MKLKDIYKKKFARLKTIEFWCDLVVYFCIFSIVGHLMEIPYCMLHSALYDIVPDDCGVWGYPLEPFVVYGIAAVFLIIFVDPIYDWMRHKVPNKAARVTIMFVGCVIVSMIFELVMGLIFNQPVDGKYPMWDNSYLPGNILGQAWIVNDIFLGAICVIFLAWVYPFMQKHFDSNPKSAKIVATVIMVVLFIINMYVSYGIFNE